MRATIYGDTGELFSHLGFKDNSYRDGDTVFLVNAVDHRHAMAYGCKLT